MARHRGLAVGAWLVVSVAGCSDGDGGSAPVATPTDPDPKPATGASTTDGGDGGATGASSPGDDDGSGGSESSAAEITSAGSNPSGTADTNDDGGPDSGTVEPTEGIIHLETLTAYDEDGQDLEVPHPARTRPGDLMVLVLHRTDDDLPLYVEGWTRVAECYKSDNDLDCSTEADCTQWHDDDFCQTFDGNGGGSGHDLAQSVFVRVVGADVPASYTFDLNREGEDEGHPGWAILTSLRGADVTEPIRDWAHTGCDDDADSVFPSVQGEPGDMVLLSQSFDDAVPQSWFQAPKGMLDLGYVSHDDEAGFLFGGVLPESGPTGPMETLGDGGPDCKDALVSLSIAPASAR